MDVAAWLQDLGLERSVSAFRDNEETGDPSAALAARTGDPATLHASLIARFDRLA